MQKGGWRGEVLPIGQAVVVILGLSVASWGILILALLLIWHLLP